MATVSVGDGAGEVSKSGADVSGFGGDGSHKWCRSLVVTEVSVGVGSDQKWCRSRWWVTKGYVQINVRV